MATKAELMASGLAAAVASKLGQDAPNTALTATGTTQGGALVITSSFSIFGTVAASSGAVLPSAHGKGTYIVVNGGVSTLSLYPFGSETINGGSASAAISVPAGKSAMLMGDNNQWGAVISA